MPLLALASESTGVLDESMMSIISNAFSNMSATVGQVLTVAVPVAVGIIALCAGVNFALKKAQGVLKKAN